MGEFDFGERSVFIVDRGTLHQVQSGVCAVNHLPKDRVFAVKMWLLCVCNEKLGFICVGPGVRHGDHTTIVELVKKDSSQNQSRTTRDELRTLSVDRTSLAKGLPHML